LLYLNSFEQLFGDILRQLGIEISSDKGVLKRHSCVVALRLTNAAKELNKILGHPIVESKKLTGSRNGGMSTDQNQFSLFVYGTARWCHRG